MTRPKGDVRKSYVPEVNGLKFDKIIASIKWRGTVRMRLAGNDDSLLGECVWPVKDGKTYYACAVTGLLFDKESGRCLQSSNVDLDLASLVPARPGDMKKYLADRGREYQRTNIRIGESA